MSTTPRPFLLGSIIELEGDNAAGAGQAASANPYLAGTPQHRYWHQGWISYEGAMTFEEFLRKRKTTYNANGDFAAEALRNPGLAGARSWQELETNLSEHHDFSQAEAARSIWQDYTDAVRKLKQA